MYTQATPSHWVQAFLYLLSLLFFLKSLDPSIHVSLLSLKLSRHVSHHSHVVIL